MSKDTRIAFRSSAELKARLKKASQTVRLAETQLAEACVEALVEYIEKHGEITLPLSVLPTSQVENQWRENSDTKTANFPTPDKTPAPSPKKTTSK